MRYPKNPDEVVAIVNEAISRGITVKAFGARHSQTDIICTEGIPVDMLKLKFSRMNDDNVTATFGAGVTLKDVGKFLLQHGRALRTTPAYGHITLGGAVGTGAHGSTLKYNSSISAQVVQMTIVDGLGRKLVISDADDLKSFKIHLGLLVLAHNYIAPDKVLTNGVALNWARASDQIMFCWFPSTKEVVVANSTFLPVETYGTAHSAIVPRTYGYSNLILHKAKEIAYELATNECTLASSLGNKIVHAIEILAKSSLFAQTPGFVPIYSEDGVLLQNPAIGFPNEMLSSVCSEENSGLTGKACVWAHGDLHANLTALDNEFAIPIDEIENFVLTVKDILSKTPTAFPVQGIIFRFSAQSDSYMSVSHGRDTVHIEFLVAKRSNSYEKASGGLAGYQTIGQSLARKFSGRSHWGKSGLIYHSSEMLDIKLNPIPRAKFVGNIGMMFNLL
ncbi:L-gulonolactone oxidase 5 [Pseudolycoriella hygida]|uniref:L-gulonolactone oxidase 5 n=1 Tax=Pseudolycoriella hygida TaxID=35572 RepID=A0A9Q0NHP3_9DIPT|nr:L-gulonolactone oxidase 5 [Pseudolycoriella hygida]